MDELRLSLSNQWLGFKGVDLMVVIFSLYLFFFFFEVKQKLEMKKRLSILSILLLPKLLKKKVVNETLAMM